MPDDTNGPRDNVPQESVQDAEHFGRENELPDADKREYWSEVEGGGVNAPDAPLSNVDPELPDGDAPRSAGSNSYGSLSGEGRPSSSATVAPTERSESEG